MNNPNVVIQLLVIAMCLAHVLFAGASLWVTALVFTLLEIGATAGKAYGRRVTRRA